ncbi:GNAT family N-acetyltransferase [Peribacillus cavernae]|uniref:GNAT family N-acetyltransferase n=1 Tax=Peribacillus cavernae TaxID=1674310 RepID=A0A433HKT2_9BACI|nr:GNAT family N-acetyltransferase [Peribacillus cavernae]MDQ0220233.1 hypothetical protein [Peribacillus cavernae]RUQ28849.1 GNAT family N-acetyltransferase [Peribacillus cavernae]
MNGIKSIQSRLEKSFRLLNGLPDYLSFEEMGLDPESFNVVKQHLQTFINAGKKMNVRRISFIINQDSSYYQALRDLLIQSNFNLFSSKVVMCRGLSDYAAEGTKYRWHSLEDEAVLSEAMFKDLWKKCMSGSDNAKSSLSMDEHMESVKSELPTSWRKSCSAVFENNRPLGIAIPHIEPGTDNEGRLFYFGLLSEERGKGKSADIHKDFLTLLKRMGAQFYIGSTGQANEKMQKVFLKNGCRFAKTTESYYYYY